MGKIKFKSSANKEIISSTKKVDKEYIEKYIDRIIEVPVYIEKEVIKEVPIYIEKEVIVEKQVPVTVEKIVQIREPKDMSVEQLRMAVTNLNEEKLILVEKHDKLLCELEATDIENTIRIDDYKKEIEKLNNKNKKQFMLIMAMGLLAAISFIL